MSNLIATLSRRSVHVAVVVVGCGLLLYPPWRGYSGVEWCFLFDPPRSPRTVSIAYDVLAAEALISALVLSVGLRAVYGANLPSRVRGVLDGWRARRTAPPPKPVATETVAPKARGRLSPWVEFVAFNVWIVGAVYFGTVYGAGALLTWLGVGALLWFKFAAGLGPARPDDTGAPPPAAPTQLVPPPVRIPRDGGFSARHLEAARRRAESPVYLTVRAIKTLFGL